MIYQIHVKTKQRVNSIASHQTAANTFIISTKDGAFENKANISVIQQLADYFKVPKSSVKITRGLKSKTKTVEIDTD